MRKKLREAKEFLGDEYRFAVIDGGDVVYRDFGRCDMEIFYLATSEPSWRGYYVVVWEKNQRWAGTPLAYNSIDGTYIEQRDPCRSLPELKEYVDEMVRRYGETYAGIVHRA